MNKKVFHYALLVYMVLIFVASSLPSKDYPDMGFVFADKIVHIAVYFVLCLLFFYSLKNQTKFAKLRSSPLVFSLVFTSLYGVTDEIHQYFVPNRSCDYRDWIANTVGALICIILIKIFYNKLPFLNSK